MTSQTANQWLSKDEPGREDELGSTRIAGLTKTSITNTTKTTCKIMHLKNKAM